MWACQLLTASCCVPSPVDCYDYDDEEDKEDDKSYGDYDDDDDEEVHLGGAPQQPAPPLSAAIQ